MRAILLCGIGLWLGCTTPAPVTAEGQVGSALQVDADLCAEHGVLEAVCTQCNPTLAPVFQAKGDWCPEHGFPLSFCPVHTPEAGGRPVANDIAASDGAPAEGTLVRLAAAVVAQQAGLRTAPAEEAPWEGGVDAVAHIVWDATRVAEVSARAAGVVSEIRADVGTPVKAGDVLAVLRSAQVGGDRARAQAAKADLSVATSERDRARSLLDRGVTTAAEVLRAEQAVSAAEASLAAVRAEVGVLGAGAGDRFTVVAPLDGVVLRREVTVGRAVDADVPLFQVVDPTRMWAELEVPEDELSVVQPGQPVRIHLEALPERTFEGRIAYVAPWVEERTRTARARVELVNEDGALRANLHGRARIVTAAPVSVVQVPAAAVQTARGKHLVFVQRDESTFVTRRVKVVARQGQVVRIEGAVQPGDRVVTTGSFLLKTETLKDSIGAGCCEGG